MHLICPFVVQKAPLDSSQRAELCGMLFSGMQLLSVSYCALRYVSLQRLYDLLVSFYGVKRPFHQVFGQLLWSKGFKGTLTAFKQRPALILVTVPR